MLRAYVTSILRKRESVEKLYTLHRCVGCLKNDTLVSHSKIRERDRIAASIAGIGARSDCIGLCTIGSWKSNLQFGIVY